MGRSDDSNDSNTAPEKELWARTGQYKMIRKQAEDCIKKGNMDIQLYLLYTWRYSTNDGMTGSFNLHEL